MFLPGLLCGLSRNFFDDYLLIPACLLSFGLLQLVLGGPFLLAIFEYKLPELATGFLGFVGKHGPVVQIFSFGAAKLKLWKFRNEILEKLGCP